MTEPPPCFTGGCRLSLLDLTMTWIHRSIRPGPLIFSPVLVSFSFLSLFLRNDASQVLYQVFAACVCVCFVCVKLPSLPFSIDLTKEMGVTVFLGQRGSNEWKSSLCPKKTFDRPSESPEIWQNYKTVCPWKQHIKTWMYLDHPSVHHKNLWIRFSSTCSSLWIFLLWIILRRHKMP